MAFALNSFEIWPVQVPGEVQPHSAPVVLSKVGEVLLDPVVDSVHSEDGLVLKGKSDEVRGQRPPIWQIDHKAFFKAF